MNSKNRKYLAIGFAVISLASLLLLARIPFHIGTVTPSAAATPTITDLTSDFNSHINSAAVHASEGFVPASASTQTSAPEKEYMLDRDQVVCPEPNAAYFKQTTSNNDIALVLSAAEELLDGQDVFWDPARERMPDSVIHYYMDETILVLNWKEIIDRACYTFTEVKIMDPSQFRRYFADDSYESDTVLYASEMAAYVNAVAGFSGDFYRRRTQGVVVYHGDLYRVEDRAYETLYVDMNGDFHFTYSEELGTIEKGEQYVRDHNINFTLTFGPVIIDNGEKVVPDSYPLGEINDPYARAVVCQLDSLHYLMVQVTGKSNTTWNSAKRVWEVADVLHELGGIKMAYVLDGGQTATCVINDEVINYVVFGYERLMTDIFYFNTAIPNEEEASS